MNLRWLVPGTIFILGVGTLYYNLGFTALSAWGIPTLMVIFAATLVTTLTWAAEKS